MHRCPTRWVINGTGLEPVTKQAPVRYPYHSATVSTSKSIGSETRQKWSPKIMSTWLYRQGFAKFPLNRHYNMKNTTGLRLTASVRANTRGLGNGPHDFKPNQYNVGRIFSGIPLSKFPHHASESTFSYE
ncbi:hypothetical protein TNCV_1163771 [Trichonephila clavipes]|nr:hypothetical protein TNCV_1163771 [Trichonephila clavipes]